MIMVTLRSNVTHRSHGHVIFEWKCTFFQLFSTIKLKPVDKMTQSNYLCVILQVKRKLILTVFTWFLILDKIQDGNHVWWHHRPPAATPPIKYTSSCREDQRLSTEGKIVSKYCNVSNTQGRVSSTSPSLPLYHYGGMTLRVRPRVKILKSLESLHVIK